METGVTLIPKDNFQKGLRLLHFTVFNEYLHEYCQAFISIMIITCCWHFTFWLSNNIKNEIVFSFFILSTSVSTIFIYSFTGFPMSFPFLLLWFFSFFDFDCFNYYHFHISSNIKSDIFIELIHLFFQPCWWRQFFNALFSIIKFLFSVCSLYFHLSCF